MRSSTALPVQCGKRQTFFGMYAKSTRDMPPPKIKKKTPSVSAKRKKESEIRIWHSPFTDLPSDIKGLFLSKSICETNLAETNKEFHDLHNVDGETKRARKMFCGKKKISFQEHSKDFTTFVSFVAKERGLLTNLDSLTIWQALTSDAGVLETFMKGLKSLPNLKELNIQSNNIGAFGASALASACASGALAELKELNLGYNRIDDTGATALANAFASGALANLKELNLDCNKVGNAGVSALAKAVGDGALAKLEKLWLNNNQIGDSGVSALAGACARALAELKELDLFNNKIGDAGVSALAEAFARGALANLKTLFVDDGPLGTEHPALKAACAERGIKLM